MTTVELIHRPLGDHHPYENSADERVPRFPYSHESVEIRVLSRPIKAVQKMTISFWDAKNPEQIETRELVFVESVKEEIAMDEDGHLSEAAARAGLVVGVDRWQANLPPLPAGMEACYRLTAEAGPELVTSKTYSYTVRKIVSLEEVNAIYHNKDSLLVLLQTPAKDHQGYLSLKALNDGYLQVEAGHGEFPDFKNTKLTHLKSTEDTAYTHDFGDTHIQLSASPFNLQILYKKEVLFSGLKAPQLVIGDANSIESVIFTVDSPQDESFYGFGERFNALNQRGQRIDIRVYEQYKNHGLRTYMPMPLFISSQGYGVLVQSSRHSLFDLAHNNPSQWSLQTELGKQQEITLDLLLGNRTQLLDIVARLNALTGCPTLPPDWAFGLWASGNEWNTQKRVEEVVKKHEEYEIPISVIVLEAWSDENTFYIWNDAQYTPKSGSDSFQYADFTFPPDGKWTDPKSMIENFHEKGVRVLLWQIPILKETEDNHTQLENDRAHMLDKGYCAHYQNGTPYEVRPFWFHKGLLMDFTHPQGTDWWMQKRKYLLTELGVDGFKTDGGEHIWGRDLIFENGKGSDEIWNEYPNLYAGAYFQFSRKHKPDAITFSRAGYTGAQAHPCHWAGDENSTWEAFRHSILAGLNAGISGVPFWGWDFAGFSGKIPTDELYLRATAMATFCPIMQYHSEYNHHRQPSNDRTPWNIAERTQNPDVISIFRFYAQLRMKLMPYILHSARQSAQTGLPMMRALSMVYPHDKKVFDYPYQYLFGDSLLVAPIVEAGVTETDIYLPEGNWRSLWDGKHFSGERVYNLPASLATIPVFVKEKSFFHKKYEPLLFL